MTRKGTPPTDLVPVISYARASSDKRKRDQHSVIDQHRVNGRTAASHGWTVVHEFTDNDKSAANPDVVRDDFELMLKALRAGKLADGTPFRGVVVTVDDRLIRRPGDYERFVEAFTYRDGFVFADEKMTKNLYSEDVESMGLFGAVISKMEVRKMQRRMRNSHRARAEDGIPVGGPRPFGWLPDRLTLDPVEAPLLRKAALDFIGGRSLHSIVTDWQRRGIQTPHGNPWVTNALKATLRNPRLCGWRRSRMDGEFVLTSEGERVIGKWKRILEPEEWNAVQAILEGRKGRAVTVDGVAGDLLPRDFRENHHLLTGILRCGKILDGGRMCNSPLTINTRKDGRYSYRCPSKPRGGCGGIARRGDMIDDFISEAVLSALEDAAVSSAPAGPTVWLRQKEFEDAQKRYDEHFRQYQAKKITSTSFYRLLPTLEADLAELRAEKNKLEASTTVRQARANTDVADIRRRWYLSEEEGGLPMSNKRVYVREAFVAVIVHPNGKTGRAPFNPDLLEPIWRED
ncbi:recombinase family protein [Streptosporangium subroseum]|uniref:recombinase family protein n=1 Tax=Streptosporangium subroseum TaxID=106412 RepID=UPI003424A631